MQLVYFRSLQNPKVFFFCISGLLFFSCRIQAAREGNVRAFILKIKSSRDVSMHLICMNLAEIIKVDERGQLVVAQYLIQHPLGKDEDQELSPLHVMAKEGTLSRHVCNKYNYPILR